MTTPQELSFPGMCSWWANAKTVKEEEQVQHFVRVFVAEMVGQVGLPSRSSCCTTPPPGRNLLLSCCQICHPYSLKLPF